MNTVRIAALAHLLAALVLTGCGTVGDIFGGNGSSAPADSPSAQEGAVRGTVQNVDTQARTLTLSADAAQSNLRNNERVVLAYDESTVVSYQGQNYSPQDLESGDRIEASTERVGDRLVARRINVLSDVSPDGAADAGQLRDFDGSVLRVDTSRRTIEVDPYGTDTAPVTVGYDANTRVVYEGRSYRPGDLERGDGIRVRTRSSGGALMADDIVVMRNANTSAAAPAEQQLRGTVRRIDSGSQTIQLDGVSWAQGFNPEVGGTATSVAYDANTIVEYQGKRYSVANLEPGDLIDVDVVSGNGGGHLARRIVVARSA